MKSTKKLKPHEIGGIEDCKKRLRIQLARGGWKEASEICNQLGNQYRLLGLYEDAVEQHTQEASICKVHKLDRLSLAIAYRNIAEVYIDMKNCSKAVPFIQKYLDIARDFRNFVEEQRALITMGRAYLSEGEDKKEALTKAKEYFRKAYTLLSDNSVKEQLNNDKEFMVMKCNNCQNLGLTLEMQGNPQALNWFEKAVEIGKQFKLIEYLQPCYSALANLYLKQKEGNKALSYAQEAVKTAVIMSSSSRETEARILEAKASFFCNKIEAGKKILKRLRKNIKPKFGCKPKELLIYLEEIDSLLVPAIKLCRKSDQLFACQKKKNKDAKLLMALHEGVADNYAALDLFSFAVDNYLKASEYAMLKSVEAPVKKISRLYFSIAESYKDCGRLEKALEYYQKEMSLFEDPDERFVTQTNIAVLYEKLNRHEEALAAHRKTLVLAEETRDTNKLKHRIATAKRNFGLYLESSGDSRADEYLADWKAYSSSSIPSSSRDDDICSQEDSQPSEDEEDIVDLENLSSDEDSGEEDGDAKNVAHARPNRIAKRKNEAGETPLHLAAKRGDLNAVRKFLRQGLDVNARDTAGWTPLHEAANFGFAKVVKELLDHKAKVSDRGGRMCEGLTPLHDALTNGHFEVADILIEGGADIMALDDMKNCPLDYLIIWRSGIEPEELKSVHHEYKRMKALLIEKMLKKGKEYSAQDERRAMKQSRVRNKSPEFTTMIATQSHIVPVRIANDDFDPDNVEEATNAYKSTMRNLQRHSEKKTAPPKKEKRKRAMSPGPRTALIPSELDVHEDWMIGDSQVVVAPSFQESKKRQAVNQEKRLCKQSKMRNESPEILSISSSSPLLFPSQGSDADSEYSSETNHNKYKSPPPPLPRCLRISSSSSSCSSSSEEGEPAEKHYISDKESKRYKSPPPQVQRSVRISSSSSEEQGVDNEVMLFEESQAAKIPLPASSLPNNKQESSTRDVLRLKIQILGNVLLVPVDGSNRNRSIEWLCDQTTSRYAQVNKVKPVISLCTKDGALLFLTDSIDLALGEETELVANVLSFDVPSLTQAFKKCCAEFQLSPRPKIVESFKICEGTNTLDLFGSNIGQKQGVWASAIFQSIQGNSALKELKLYQCCLSDDDIKGLGKVIGTLSGLSVLDLSSNAITFNGIKYLEEGLSSQKDCGANAVKELNLSYNPLGNDVAARIVRLTCLLPNLKFLKLADCNLSSRFFTNLGKEEELFSLESSGGEDRFSTLVDVDLLRSFGTNMKK